MCAGSGSEAVEKAREFLSDVILLDLLLPNLDGVSVCEILPRQSTTPTTPIIMISSLTSDPTRSAAKRAGAGDDLGKPLDFSALKRVLESLLNVSSELGIA